MKQINLCPKKIHAAMQFEAKNDVRYYLNGIHLRNGHIESTDGHACISMKADIVIKEPFNIKIKGKIPLKSVFSKLVFNDDKRSATLVHYDEKQNPIASNFVELEFNVRRFPDLELLIKQAKESGGSPIFRTALLSIIDKAFRSVKDEHRLFSFKSKSAEGANSILFSKLISIEYGSPKVLVMPSSGEVE